MHTRSDLYDENLSGWLCPEASGTCCSITALPKAYTARFGGVKPAARKKCLCTEAFCHAELVESYAQGHTSCLSSALVGVL